MTFKIEQVPLDYRGAGRLVNPITATMRKLKVGESFVVPYGNESWTGSQIRNENMRKKGHFVSRREKDGWRIGRVK